MFAKELSHEIQLQSIPSASEICKSQSPLARLLQRRCYRSKQEVASRPSVGQQLWPIIFLLQLFGCSPIQVQSNNGKNGGKGCGFRFFSAKSALPFCSAVYFTFLWVKYMIELGFKQSFFGNSLKISKEYFTNFTSHPRNERSIHGWISHPSITMDSVGTFILVVIPLERIVEIILSWTGASQMAAFFNGWEDLELQYQEICSADGMDQGESNSNVNEYPQAQPQLYHHPHPSLPLHYAREPLINLVSWRNKFLILYVLLPAVVVFPFYFYANLKGIHRLDLLDIFITSTLSFHFVVCCLLHNATCVFTYKIVSEGFYKVKLRMASLVKAKQMDPKTLYTWRSFVESLREQCYLIGELQMHQQLFKLGSTLTIITVMIFIVLNGDHRNPNSLRVTLVSLGYALDLLVQLYTKTSIADQVTQNEKGIAEVMTSVPTHLIDDATYREVKFIHDMILMNPAKISLGNYVDLNKKLLLVVASQVATYIVVLMQLSHH